MGDLLQSGRQTPVTNLSLVVTQISVLGRICFFTITLSWQTGALAILHGILHAVPHGFPSSLAVPEESCHPARSFSSQTTKAGGRCGRHAQHFSSLCPDLLTHSTLGPTVLYLHSYPVWWVSGSPVAS